MDHAGRQDLEIIPKIELHLHLEGALSERQLQKLARKYETALASTQSDAITALYDFQTFAEFLNAYKVCCRHLKNPEDYGQLAASLLRQLADQRCVYAEILFTPSICKHFGLSAEEVIEAVLEQSAMARRSGIESRWIFDTVRQWGPDLCWQTLEWALQYRDRGVAAISIGGDEASQPAREFREVFESAEKEGIHRTAHAGEICDSRSVWLAIDELRVERIGHGIHALADPLLVDHLIRHAIPLDISITSNFRTGAAARERPHPIAEIARLGIPFTLNTDDPGLFRTSLLDEWEQAARILGWLPDQFVELMRQTVQHTFLSDNDRQRIRALLM